MKKKLIIILSLFCICLFLTGCVNNHDTIEIYNKSNYVFDNITIYTKDGYFYNRHKTFIVDDNTIGITIYFSTEEEDSRYPWEE